METNLAYEGLFHGRYAMQLRPVAQSTAQTKNRAFVIPGQGAAYTGMFVDQLKSLPVFRDCFALADQRCADFDLLPCSLYITKPGALPADKIHMYRNCAIFTVEVALGRYLIEQGLNPSVVTGHSFGENAALVLSGLIDFETMFSVVAYRNVLAPPPNKLGFMIAISGKESSLDGLMKIPGVYLANRNSHRQVVVAVATASREPALEYIQKNRIAHVLLEQLPQPYHSPLMEDFRKILHDRISKMRIQVSEPTIDLFSCVTHSWIDKSNYTTLDVVDLLSRQATEPVDFVEQVAALRSHAANAFYEVGPGQMLESSIRALSKDEPYAYRHAHQLLDALGSQKREESVATERLSKSKWFGKIRDAIQAVAGYSKDEIEISSSFQNDLGIDSIKKAEILFKIISDENIPSGSNFSISRFSTISQAVDYLENFSDSTDPLRQSHQSEVSLVESRWRESLNPIHFYKQARRASYVVARLIPNLAHPEEMLEEAYRQTEANGQNKKQTLVVVDFGQESFDASDFLLGLHAAYTKQMALGQTPKFDFMVIDRSGGEKFRAIASLWKSLRKEFGTTRTLYVQSDRDLEDSELIVDICFSATRDLRYAEGKRFVRDFVPVPLSSRYVRQAAATVVAIGGNRGINFEVLKNFPVRPGDRLVLVARTPAHRPEISNHIAILKAHWPDFTYVTADANKFESLKEAIGNATGETKKIDILLNACGYEVSRRFDEKSADEVRDEFASKWLPFQNVERLRDSFTIDKLIHYSSLVSEFGNRGQAVYAYSNCLIEAACEQSGSRVIAWGPWENVGMTENSGVRGRLSEWGASLVNPEVGSALTYKLLFGAKAVPNSVKGFDIKDAPMCSSDRDINELQSPIVGVVQNAFEASFMKDLDVATEPFLAEHAHNDKPLVPAAYFVATFLSIGRAQFAREVSLANFELQNPTVLENSRFQIKYQAFFRKPYFMQAYSVIPHCSANIDADAAWAPVELPNFAATNSVMIESWYETWAIRTGPKFRLLRTAEIDKDGGMRMPVDTSTFPTYIDDDYFDFHLALCEASLQSFSFQANKDADSVTVPISCERIMINPNVSSERHLTIRPYVRKKDQRFWIGDVDVKNSSGETVYRIVGLRALLVPKPEKSIR